MINHDLDRFYGNKRDLDNRKKRVEVIASVGMFTSEKGKGDPLLPIHRRLTKDIQLYITVKSNFPSK